jgi:hypothetical protein
MHLLATKALMAQAMPKLYSVPKHFKFQKYVEISILQAGQLIPEDCLLPSHSFQLVLASHLSMNHF